ncbi:MAG TPA: prepilin-type N-terminal cleavage/methylation domain-containing protein [Deltaproteobacteria bacterium]|nr:prepilin-type N-terminal cleavage/methylation domain-containing protein [Deltaproteobacteria bacterium]
MKRRSCRFFRGADGFTLLELLLALAIAAMVITTVNMTFFLSHRNIRAISEQREAYQMVRITMDRIIKDITCAYVPSSEQELSTVEVSLYRFIGVHGTGFEMDRDSLVLTTTTNIGFSSIFAGLTEVAYYLKEMDEKPGLYMLMRREDPLPHYGISTSGPELELAEDLVKMNIEYIDEYSQSRDEWDLETERSLPRQVRVSLTFSKGEESLTFTAVASPPLAGIKIKGAQG